MQYLPKRVNNIELIVSALGNVGIWVGWVGDTDKPTETNAFWTSLATMPDNCMIIGLDPTVFGDNNFHVVFRRGGTTLVNEDIGDTIPLSTHVEIDGFIDDLSQNSYFYIDSSLAFSHAGDFPTAQMQQYFAVVSRGVPGENLDFHLHDFKLIFDAERIDV